MLNTDAMSPGDELILDRYEDFFPKDWLMDTARDTGLIERLRDFHPAVVFWILVLQVGVRFQTCLESLRRDYNAHADDAMAHASFYERFTPELVAFLKACVKRGITKLSELKGRKLSDRLARFEDLMIQDSTIIRVHEKLADQWPAARSKKVAAGLKLSCLVSVVADGPKRVKVMGERVAEIQTLNIGSWVEDRLLLVDLGFYKHHAFHCIDQQGGFFVSRLKSNANPTVVEQNNTVRGNSITVEGLGIQEVLERCQREIVDVQVEVSFKQRPYEGTRSSATKLFRVVAVRNDETDEYHAYLTNLSADEFAGEEIASLYRCRWEVELVFRELKDKFCIDEIPTGNPHAVKAMLWSGILTLLLHRVAFVTMCEVNPDRAEHYSHEASAQAFRERAAQILLSGILDRQGFDAGAISAMGALDSGAFDSYRETGVHLDTWLA